MQSDADGLVTEHVTYAYDSGEVVRDVSIGLRRGEMLAVAGPNGSGKTTLLKLLSGVRQPASGQVSLDGRPMTSFTPRQRALRIAVVSQHTDHNLMFSVWDIVAMGRTPYSTLLRSSDLSGRRAIVSALRTAEIETLAHRRFGELSGGEQQRVMLASALAQETDYLLLDEPTVHLDLHHQHHLLEVLSRLRSERSIGILTVMHDLNLAALYFNRLALMHDGELVADGSPDYILTHSGHLSIFHAPLAVGRHPVDDVPQLFLRRGGS